MSFAAGFITGVVVMLALWAALIVAYFIHDKRETRRAEQGSAQEEARGGK